MIRLPDEPVSGAALPEIPFATLPAFFAARVAADPQRVAVRHRNAAGKWQDLTWERLDERRRAVAGALQEMGVGPGHVVAFVAPNSAEMLIAELAVWTLGAATAPIFPGYTRDVVLHCLADSGARIVFAGSAVQQHLLHGVELERLIVLDDAPFGNALPLKALETAGAPLREPEAGADDVAFVLYTSGTTGKPKGVELTHRNALSQQAALAQTWDLTADDVLLSYLPWHHCFGALFERLAALWHRALLVIDDSRGRDLDRLVQNLAEVRPTVYLGVPRVYNALIGRAVRDAATRKALVEGRLRWIFSAAAPLPEPAFRFFEGHGIPVLEGWGLTETSPCATITRRDATRRAGVVGFPIPGTTVKLDPVEGVRGRGEILVKGPQVMRGYRNRPAETARVLQDGFLRSGDLAEWTPEGLRLHGRVDGVFKLENGEKVSAGEVEARVLAATPLLEQCVVFGAGQPFVTALAWIAEGPARRWLEEQGLDVPADPAALAGVPELRLAVAEALRAANLLASVHYERVRRVGLVAEPPSIETGELTPTQKMVRHVSAARHAALLAALCEERPDARVLEIFRHGDPFTHA